MTYLNNLAVFREVLLSELAAKTGKAVFSNIDGQLGTIIEVNRVILSALEDAAASGWTTKTVGSIFLSYAPMLKCYKNYVAGYAEADALVKDAMTAREFTKVLDGIMADPAKRARLQGLDFTGFLIMPIQRIPRYEMLLGSLAKSTGEDHPEHAELVQAYEAVKDISNTLNGEITLREKQAAVISLNSYLFKPPAPGAAAPTQPAGIVSPSRVFIMSSRYFLPRSLNSVAPQCVESGATRYLAGTSHDRRRFSRVLEPSSSRAGSPTAGVRVMLYLFNDLLLVTQPADVGGVGASTRSIGSSGGAEDSPGTAVVLARIPITASVDVTTLPERGILALRSLSGAVTGLLLSAVADQGDPASKVRKWSDSISAAVTSLKETAQRKAAISQRLNLGPPPAAAAAASGNGTAFSAPGDLHLPTAVAAAGGRMVHFHSPAALAAAGAGDGVISLESILSPSAVAEKRASLLNSILQGTAGTPFDEASAKVITRRGSERLVTAQMAMSIMESPLQKRGKGAFGGWRSRWFVLQVHPLRDPVPGLTPNLDIAKAARLAAAADASGRPMSVPFAYPLPEVTGSLHYYESRKAFDSGAQPKGTIDLAQVEGVVWYGGSSSGDGKRFDVKTSGQRDYEIRATSVPGSTSAEAVEALAKNWVAMLVCVEELKAKVADLHDELQRRKTELTLFKQDPPAQDGKDEDAADAPPAEEASTRAPKLGAQKRPPPPAGARKEPPPALPGRAATPPLVGSAIPEAEEEEAESEGAPSPLPRGATPPVSTSPPASGAPEPSADAPRAAHKESIAIPAAKPAPPQARLPDTAPDAAQGAAPQDVSAKPPVPAAGKAPRATSSGRSRPPPPAAGKRAGSAQRKPPPPGKTASGSRAASPTDSDGSDGKRGPAPTPASSSTSRAPSPPLPASQQPKAGPPVTTSKAGPPPGARRHTGKPAQPPGLPAALQQPQRRATEPPASAKAAQPKPDPAGEAESEVQTPPQAAPGQEPALEAVQEDGEDSEEQDAGPSPLPETKAAPGLPSGATKARKQFRITPMNPHLSGQVRHKKAARYSKPAMQPLEGAASVIAKFRQAEKKNTGPRNQWNQHMWSKSQEEITNLAPRIQSKGRRWRKPGSTQPSAEEEAAEEGEDSPLQAAPAPKGDGAAAAIKASVPPSPSPSMKSATSPAPSIGKEGAISGRVVRTLPRQELHNTVLQGDAGTFATASTASAAQATALSGSHLVYAGEPMPKSVVVGAERRALEHSPATALALLQEYARNGLSSRALAFFSDMRHHLGVMGLASGVAGGGASTALHPAQLARAYALVIAAFGKAGRVAGAQTWFAKGLDDVNAAVAAWWRAAPDKASINPENTRSVCGLMLHTAMLRAFARAGMVSHARNVVKCLIARRLPVLPHHVHCVVVAAGVSGDHLAVGEELLRWMRRGHVPLAATVAVFIQALGAAGKPHSAATLFDALTAGADAQFVTSLVNTATLSAEGGDAGPGADAAKCPLSTESGLTRAQMSQSRPVKRELEAVRLILTSAEDTLRARREAEETPTRSDSCAALAGGDGGVSLLPSRPSPSPAPIHMPLLSALLQGQGGAGEGSQASRLHLSRVVAEMTSRLNSINGIGNDDLAAILQAQATVPGDSARGVRATKPAAEQGQGAGTTRGAVTLTGLFPCVAGKRAGAGFVAADTSTYAAAIAAMGRCGLPHLSDRVLDHMKLAERESCRRQNLMAEAAASLGLATQPYACTHLPPSGVLSSSVFDAVDDGQLLDTVLEAAKHPRVDAAAAVEGSVASLRRLSAPLPPVRANEVAYTALAFAHAAANNVNGVHQAVSSAESAGLASTPCMAAALVTVYGSKGDLDSARRLYHQALAAQRAAQDNVEAGKAESCDVVLTGSVPALHQAYLHVLAQAGAVPEARTVALSLLRPHDYVKSIAADAASSTPTKNPTASPLRRSVRAVLAAEEKSAAALGVGESSSAAAEGSEEDVTLGCLSTALFNALLLCYGADGASDKLADLADTMAGADVTPSPESFGTLLSTLAAHDMAEAGVQAAEVLAASTALSPHAQNALDVQALLAQEGIDAPPPAASLGPAVQQHVAGRRFDPLAKAALVAVKESAAKAARAAASLSKDGASGAGTGALQVPFSMTPAVTPALANVLRGRSAVLPGEASRCSGAAGCLMTHMYIKAGQLAAARLTLAGVERGIAVPRSDIQGCYDALVAAFAAEGASAAVDECLAAMEESGQMAGETEQGACLQGNDAPAPSPSGTDVHSLVADPCSCTDSGRDDVGADAADAGEALGKRGMSRLVRCAANASVMEGTFRKLMSSYGLQGKVQRARATFEGIQRVRANKKLTEDMAAAALPGGEDDAAQEVMRGALSKWAADATRAGMVAEDEAAEALNGQEGLAALMDSMVAVAGAGTAARSTSRQLCGTVSGDEVQHGPEGGDDTQHVSMYTPDTTSDAADASAAPRAGMDALVAASAPAALNVTAAAVTTGFSAEVEASAKAMAKKRRASKAAKQAAAAEAGADDALAASSSDEEEDATGTSLGAEAFNVLIDAYGEGCRLDLAVGTLSEMLQDGTVPNAGTLIALINGFSLSGRGAEVLGVMDQVHSLLSTRSHLSEASINKLLMDHGVVAARLAALGTSGRPDLVHAAWLSYCEFKLGFEPSGPKSDGVNNVERLLPVFPVYSQLPGSVTSDTHRALAEAYLSAQAMALSRCGGNAHYATACVRSAAGLVRGQEQAEAEASSGGDPLRAALASLPVPTQLDECVALMQDTAAALAELGHPMSITALTSLALAYRMAGMSDAGRQLLMQAVGLVAQATSRGASAIRHYHVPTGTPTSSAGWGYGMDCIHMDGHEDTTMVAVEEGATAAPVPGTLVPSDVRLDPEILAALITALGANGMTGEVRAVLESVSRSAGVVDTAAAVKHVRSAIGLEAATAQDEGSGASQAVVSAWNDLTDDLRHMLYAAFGMRRDVATADRLWRAGGYSARVYTKAITSRRGDAGGDGMVSADHKGIVMMAAGGEPEDSPARSTRSGKAPPSPPRRRRHRQSIALTPMNALAPKVSLASMPIGRGSGTAEEPEAPTPAGGLPSEDAAAGDWIETAVLALVRNAQHNLLTHMATVKSAEVQGDAQSAAARMMAGEGVLGVVFDPTLNTAPASPRGGGDFSYASARDATAASFKTPSQAPGPPSRRPGPPAGPPSRRKKTASAAVRRRPSMLMSAVALQGASGSAAGFNAAALMEEAPSTPEPSPYALPSLAEEGPSDGDSDGAQAPSEEEAAQRALLQRVSQVTSAPNAGGGSGMDEAGALFSPLAAALKVAALCAEGKVDAALGVMLPWWRLRLERRSTSLAARRRSSRLMMGSQGRDAGAPPPRQAPASGAMPDDDSVPGVGVVYWSDSDDDEGGDEEAAGVRGVRKVKRRLPFRPLPETVSHLLHAIARTMRERMGTLEAQAKRRAATAGTTSKRGSVSVGEPMAPAASLSVHSDPVLALYEDVMWRLVRAVTVGGGLMLSDTDHAAILEVVALRGRVKEACDRMVTQARADGTAPLRTMRLSHLAAYAASHNDAASVAAGAASVGLPQAVAGASITAFNAVLAGLAGSPALTLKAAEFVAMRMRQWYVPPDMSTASAVEAMSQRLKVDLHPLFNTRSPRQLHMQSQRDPWARGADVEAPSRPNQPSLAAALFFKLPGRPGSGLTSVTTAVGSVVGRWRGATLARRVALLQSAVAKAVHTFMFSVGGVVVGGMLAGASPLSIEVHAGMLPPSLASLLRGTLASVPPVSLPGAAPVREGAAEDPWSASPDAAAPPTGRRRGYTVQRPGRKGAEETRERARTLYPAADIVPLGGMGQGMWSSTTAELVAGQADLLDASSSVGGVYSDAEDVDASDAGKSDGEVNEHIRALTLGSTLADAAARRKLDARFIPPPPPRRKVRRVDEEKARAVEAARAAVFSSSPEFGFFTADMAGRSAARREAGSGTVPSLEDIQESAVASTALFDNAYDRELAEKAKAKQTAAATTYDFVAAAGLKAASPPAEGLDTTVFNRTPSPKKLSSDPKSLSHSLAWKGMQSRVDHALAGRAVGLSPEKDPPQQLLEAAPAHSEAYSALATDARPAHPGVGPGEALPDRVQREVLYQRPGGEAVIKVASPAKGGHTVASSTSPGHSPGVDLAHDPTTQAEGELARTSSATSPSRKVAGLAGAHDAQQDLLSFAAGGAKEASEAGAPVPSALEAYLADPSFTVTRDDVLTVRAELVSLSAELASTVATMMRSEASLNATQAQGAQADSYARAVTGLGLRDVGTAALSEAMALRSDTALTEAVAAVASGASPSTDIVPAHLATAQPSAADLVVLSSTHPAATLPPVTATELTQRVNWSRLVKPFSGADIMTESGKRDVARRRVATLRAAHARLEREEGELAMRLAATTPHARAARELLAGYQDAVKELNGRERAMRSQVARDEAACDALASGPGRDRATLRAWAEGKPGVGALHPESSILGQTGQVLRSARTSAAAAFSRQLDGMVANVALLEQVEADTAERVAAQRKRVDALVAASLNLEEDIAALKEEEAGLAAEIAELEERFEEALATNDAVADQLHQTGIKAKEVLAHTRVDAATAREHGIEVAMREARVRGARTADAEGRAAVEAATNDWAERTAAHAHSVAEKLKAVRARVSEEMSGHLQPLLKEAEAEARSAAGERAALEEQLTAMEERLSFLSSETGALTKHTDTLRGVQDSILSGERLAPEGLRQQLGELAVQPFQPQHEGDEDQRSVALDLMQSLRIPAVDMTAFVEEAVEVSQAQACAPDAVEAIFKLYAEEGQTRQEAHKARKAAAATAEAGELAVASSPLRRPSPSSSPGSSTAAQLKDIYAPPVSPDAGPGRYESALAGLHDVAAAQERLLDAAEAEGVVRSPDGQAGALAALADTASSVGSGSEFSQGGGAGTATLPRGGDGQRTGRLTGAYTMALLRSAGLSAAEAASLAVAPDTSEAIAAGDKERGAGTQAGSFARRVSFTPAHSRTRRASSMTAGSARSSRSRGSSAAPAPAPAPAPASKWARNTAKKQPAPTPRADAAAKLLRRASHGILPQMGAVRHTPDTTRRRIVGGAGKAGGASNMTLTTSPTHGGDGQRVEVQSSVAGSLSRDLAPTAGKAGQRTKTVMPPSVTRAMLSKSAAAAEVMRAALEAQERAGDYVGREEEAAAPASTTKLGRKPGRGQAGARGKVQSAAAFSPLPTSQRRGSYWGSSSYFKVHGASATPAALAGIEEGAGVKGVQAVPRLNKALRRQEANRRAAEQASSVATGQTYGGESRGQDFIDPTASGRRGSYFGTYSGRGGGAAPRRGLRK